MATRAHITIEINGKEVDWPIPYIRWDGGKCCYLLPIFLEDNKTVLDGTALYNKLLHFIVENNLELRMQNYQEFLCEGEGKFTFAINFQTDKEWHLEQWKRPEEEDKVRRMTKEEMRKDASKYFEYYENYGWQK